MLTRSKILLALGVCGGLAAVIVLPALSAPSNPAAPKSPPIAHLPGGAQSQEGGAIGLPELSRESKKCVDCHKQENVALYQQWGESKHYRANVGCYECHMAEKGEKDSTLR